MLRKLTRYSLALALVALLAACNKSEQATSVAAAPVTPQGTVDTAIQSLRANDLKSLLNSQIPPNHIEKMRAKWKEDMAKEEVTEQDRKEFAETMTKLTAPGAEDKLLAELEPQLVKFEQEMLPQMPMMVGMGKGLIMQSVQESKELTEPQKIEAGKSLDALVKWIQETKFADRALAKQAIGHVCAAARELNLKTVDEARALSFDDALTKGSIALRATKQVLTTYGLDLDKMLDTVKSEVVSQEGDKAKVKVSYEMFGQPLSFETELVQVDGHWYGKQTLDELNKPEVATPSADEASSESSDEGEGDAAESDDSEGKAEG
jgi:hypothetical protein